MTTPDSTDQERQAFELGVTAAENAASWTVDGNTTQEHVQRMLAMLDAGDPQAYDFLPAEPNLSGEWADAPTPTSLTRDIMGEDYLDGSTEANETLDALADAYERGVAETFQPECERILREAMEDGSTPGMPGNDDPDERHDYEA